MKLLVKNINPSIQQNLEVLLGSDKNKYTTARTDAEAVSL
jgi:hypothetical protein